MSIGASPNLSGGLAMAGSCLTPTDPGNGNAYTSMPLTCTPGGGGNCGGNDNAGSCSNSPGNGGNASGGGNSSSGNGGVIIIGTPTFPPPGVLSPNLSSVPPPTTTSVPCDVVPGLPTPVLLTTSSLFGAPSVVTLSGFFYRNISGLNVTCLETGVTLTSACSGGAFFYLDPALFPNGSTCNFSTPGGIGENCGDSSIHTYSSGQTTGVVSGGTVLTGQIVLTQS